MSTPNVLFCECPRASAAAFAMRVVVLGFAMLATVAQAMHVHPDSLLYHVEHSLVRYGDESRRLVLSRSYVSDTQPGVLGIGWVTRADAIVRVNGEGALELALTGRQTSELFVPVSGGRTVEKTVDLIVEKVRAAKKISDADEPRFRRDLTADASLRYRLAESWKLIPALEGPWRNGGNTAERTASGFRFTEPCQNKGCAAAFTSRLDFDDSGRIVGDASLLGDKVVEYRFVWDADRLVAISDGEGTRWVTFHYSKDAGRLERMVSGKVEIVVQSDAAGRDVGLDVQSDGVLERRIRYGRGSHHLITSYSDETLDRVGKVVTRYGDVIEYQSVAGTNRVRSIARDAGCTETYKADVTPGVDAAPGEAYRVTIGETCPDSVLSRFLDGNLVGCTPGEQSAADRIALEEARAVADSGDPFADAGSSAAKDFVLGFTSDGKLVYAEGPGMPTIRSVKRDEQGQVVALETAALRIDSAGDDVKYHLLTGPYAGQIIGQVKYTSLTGGVHHVKLLTWGDALGVEKDLPARALWEKEIQTTETWFASLINSMHNLNLRQCQ